MNATREQLKGIFKNTMVISYGFTFHETMAEPFKNLKGFSPKTYTEIGYNVYYLYISSDQTVYRNKPSCASSNRPFVMKFRIKRDNPQLG